jgi:hypothetical protein
LFVLEAWDRFHLLQLCLKLLKFSKKFHMFYVSTEMLWLDSYNGKHTLTFFVRIDNLSGELIVESMNFSVDRERQIIVL